MGLNDGPLENMWPSFINIACVQGRKYLEQCPSENPYLVRGESRYCCSETQPSDIHEQCCSVLRTVGSGFDRLDSDEKNVIQHKRSYDKYSKLLQCGGLPGLPVQEVGPLPANQTPPKSIYTEKKMVGYEK